MIRSICLNPVIDRMYFVDDFVPAKKFKAVVPHMYAGGKGVNIARVLALMDEPVKLYSYIGGNAGEFLKNEISKFAGIDSSFFLTEGETRTTINIIDRKKNQETEITEPGVQITPALQKSFLQGIASDISAGDIVVCSGTPIAGISLDIYRQISGICESKKAFCVLDVNGSCMRDSLPAKYTFMKPNRQELLDFYDINNERLTDIGINNLAAKIMELGVQRLLISDGENGGYYFDESNSCKVSVPHKQIVSTIGSGDATVAGFCLGLSREQSTEDCLRLAMACGVCNAMFAEPGYVSKNLVNDLLSEIMFE